MLGAAGMLGNAVLRLFAQSPEYEVYGSVRSDAGRNFLPKHFHQNIFTGVDVNNTDSLIQLFSIVRPDIVINCIGLVKQLTRVDEPLLAIPINSLLPHQLASLCKLVGARLVHISTDCVFSGKKGRYTETDVADSTDLYGRSKLLGEVDYPHAITLRTSLIGHELDGAHSLVEWFLSQDHSIKGFKCAIFSGLPTVELAIVIRDYVIPHPELHGVYHISSEPISKFDLLVLVAEIYGKAINIIEDYQLVIDRSLDCTQFRNATSFVPKKWPDLIHSMRNFG